MLTLVLAGLSTRAFSVWARGQGYHLPHGSWLRLHLLDIMLAVFWIGWLLALAGAVTAIWR